MGLEQKLERSEELLEVNEQNKEQVEQARRRHQQAESQVHSGTVRVQNCQNQLQQAIAARNAAIQNASRDENAAPPDTSSYDAAISRAREALSAALGREVITCENGRFAGAIGAAVSGLKL